MTREEGFETTMAAPFNPQAVDGFNDWLLPRRSRVERYQNHFYVAMAHISSGVSLPPWVSGDYFFEPHEHVAGSGGQGTKTSNRYTLSTRGFGVRIDCETYPSSELPMPNGHRPEDVTFPTECGNEVLLNNARQGMRTGVNSRPSGRSSVEFVSTLSQRGVKSPCGLPMTLGWGRTPHAEDLNGTAQASLAVCRPTFQTAMFNVTINNSGYVLGYNRTTDIATGFEYPRSKNLTEQVMSQANYQLNQGSSIWHNDTLATNWLSYLLILEMGSRYILDPAEPVPDPEDLIEPFSNVYKLLFSIFLGLNQRLFEKPEASTDQVGGVKYVEETKIFIDQPAFIITITVLVMNIVGAILFYSRGVVFVLPRMPTSIGSLLAYVAPSRMVTSHQHSSTYSFGRYLGPDGSTHLGIEMDPHVVPVNPQSLQSHQTDFGMRMRMPFAENKSTTRKKAQPRL